MARRRKFRIELSPREDERDDCAHYSECLSEVARTNRGQNQCVPCLGCNRYEQAKPVGLDAFRKRGDWNPAGDS